MESSGFIVGENYYGVTVKNIIIDDYRLGWELPNFHGVSVDEIVEFPC